MDYHNAIRWYQCVPTKWFIMACQFIGLATHLRAFPENEVKKGQLTWKTALSSVFYYFFTSLSITANYHCLWCPLRLGPISGPTVAMSPIATLPSMALHHPLGCRPMASPRSWIGRAHV